ncbi:MAG: hypothetical protein ACRD9W_10535, partial [Terriglobia bacterium]
AQSADDRALTDRLAAAAGGLKLLQLGDNPLNKLAVPDDVARNYVNGLDKTAAAVAKIQAFNDILDDAVVQIASTLIPVVAEVNWIRAGMVGIKAGTEAAAAVEVGGKAASTLIGQVIGLPQYAYNSVFSIWQTYQQHEEVRFAYSTVSVLGVDRYFEAEAQQTPWWKTALLIFRDTVMQGKDIVQAVEPLRNALKVWRGEELLPHLTGKLPVVRQMPPEAQQEGAVALLKEKESLELTGLADARAEEASIRLENLGAEAKGEAPGPVLPPIPAEIVAQRVEPIDHMVPGEVVPVDPLREPKAQLAEAHIADEVREGPAPAWADEETAKAREEATVKEPPAAAPALPSVPTPPAGPVELDAGVRQPISIAPEHPAPGSSFTVVLNVGGEQTPVTFELGDLISDKSAIFNVYELKTIPAVLKDKGFVPPEMGDRLVIKLLKRNPQYKAAVEAKSSYNVGMLDGVAKRMLKAEDTLKSRNIQHLPVVGWADAEILLQKYITKKAINFKLLEGSQLAKLET